MGAFAALASAALSSVAGVYLEAVIKGGPAPARVKVSIYIQRVYIYIHIYIYIWI